MIVKTHFTKKQQAAIHSLFSVPFGRLGEIEAKERRLPIAAVQQALDLPDIPYSQFLGPECWLAGGGILRWLCSGGKQVRPGQGDFDFFFPSLAALNRTARSMLEQGFTVRGYRALSRNLSEYFKGSLHRDWDSGIWDADGRLVPLTLDLVLGLRLAYLELNSPSGDVIQLITSCYNSPAETISRFDLSICQFIAAGKMLSFGPWALNDLLSNRVRAEHLSRPDASFQRMFRYALRGFLPYPSSALRISSAFLLQLTKVPQLLVRPMPAGNLDLFR